MSWEWLLPKKEPWRENIDLLIEPEPTPAMKPCPFCNGKPRMHRSHHEIWWGAQVVCDDCGAAAPTKWEDSAEAAAYAAARAWNRRD